MKNLTDQYGVRTYNTLWETYETLTHTHSLSQKRAASLFGPKAHATSDAAFDPLREVSA